MNYQEVSNHAKALLDANRSEWEPRYMSYSKTITNSADVIKYASEKFHEWPPLYVYSCVSTANAANSHRVEFDLRYKGQSVAILEVKGKDITVKPNNTEKNASAFGYMETERFPWLSDKGTALRKHFREYPKKEHQLEHRYESALLTELSKSKSADKQVINIQPVRLIGSRFQMPTPFSASGNELKYSGYSGGGIDLLCRTGIGKSNLSVFELKDEYENPENVLRQGIAYATFIRELLRSSAAGSDAWWKLFEFSKSRTQDKSLKINVVAALPDKGNNDKSFANTEISIENDILQLHYFYFNVSGIDDQVENVSTSIEELEVR